VNSFAAAYPLFRLAFPLPAIHLPIATTTFYHKPCNRATFPLLNPHTQLNFQLKFKTEEGMGKLLRAEPEGLKYLEGYPQAKDLLKKAKWLRFIQKFKGYNKEVTKAFAWSFDGQMVEIRDLKLTVTETTVAAATGLPQEGERWFKNKSVDEQAWGIMLRNPGMDTNVFTKGILVHALKEEWASLLLVIQKFITCKGCFGSMYMYQARLLMNFLESQTLNLPYFLLLSLKKMSITVQKHIGNIEPHLYHHGLVKFLIEDQLKNNKDTWEQFLIRNYFQEPSEASGSSTPKILRKSKRKEKSAIVQDSPTTETQEVGQKEKENRTKDKKQRKVKGKRNIQEVYQSREPSIEEDYQTLSERLVHFQEQVAIAKKKKKGNRAYKKGVLVHHT